MSALTRATLERVAAQAPATTKARPTTSLAPSDMGAAVLDDLRALGIGTGPAKPHKDGGRVQELDRCPYSADHDAGAYLVIYPDGVPYVRCHHDRCRDKAIRDHANLFPLATKAIRAHYAAQRTPTPLTVKQSDGAGDAPAVEPKPPRPISDLEPGWAILDRVLAYLGRFVAYPSAHARIAHALWIAHTHAMERWDSTPRIAFLSPEPASGKSRALEVSEPLTPRPLMALNMSAAYLFRKVADAAGRPTILFDEVDTVFGPKAGPHEEVRGLLNAGHRKGAKAGRVEMHGKTAVPVEYPAYCAVALAGLGDLPDTILTRSVIVRMRRRAPGERIAPWRARIEEGRAHQLREELAEWVAAADAAGLLAWPELPPGVEDRDADVWEPLISIADAAGGNWPALARAAATDLVTDAKDRTPSLGVRLLEDLRAVFGGADALATDAILKALCALDEAPWGEIVAGKPLNARGLARRLHAYGVKSANTRTNGNVAKGYRREDLADAWNRYLPPLSEKSATSATSVTEGHMADKNSRHSGESGALTNVAVWDRQSATHPLKRTTSATESSRHAGDVADVADVADFSGGGETPAIGALPGAFPEPSGTTPPVLIRRCVQCDAPALDGALYCERHGGRLAPTGTDGKREEIWD
jgi:hypothetical protein